MDLMTEKNTDKKNTPAAGKSGKRWIVFLVVLLAFFAGGLAAGYLLIPKRILQPSLAPHPAAQDEDVSYLRVYYPVKGRLQMEERSVSPAATEEKAVALAALREYLKGPAGEAGAEMPANAKPLGVYFGTNGVLYADLSDEFRSNFQGDALSEYLLLRGLYETLLSNVRGIRDVMLLVEGKEVESIGGHIDADGPLGEITATRQIAKKETGDGGQ